MEDTAQHQRGEQGSAIVEKRSCHRRMRPHITANPQHGKKPTPSRKSVFDKTNAARRSRMEHRWAWEEQLKRLLLH